MTYHHDLPRDILMERKEIYAGIKPHNLFWNRFFAKTLCWFHHSWGPERREEAGNGYLDVKRYCRHCGTPDWSRVKLF